MERNIIPLNDYEERSHWTKTFIFLPFKIMSTAYTGFRRKDSGVVPSQHAVVSSPAFHVNLFLTHHTRLTLCWHNRAVSKWFYTETFQAVQQEIHLVVEVPRLVVFLCTLPTEDGFVVYLDELPLWAVAEMSKKAAKAKDNLLKKLIYTSYQATH